MNKFLYGDRGNVPALLAAGDSTWASIESGYESGKPNGVQPPIFDSACMQSTDDDSVDPIECMSPAGTIFSAEGEIIDLPSSAPTETSAPTSTYNPTHWPTFAPSRRPSHSPTPLLR